MRLRLITIVSTLYISILPIFGALNDTIAYSTVNGMSHDRILGFYQDSDGIMWICTWYGIDRFDGYQFDSFRPHKELGVNSRFKQVSAVNDTLFIRTINGTILKFELNTYRYSRCDAPGLYKGRRLSRKFTDSDGNVWDYISSGVRFISIHPDNYDMVANKPNQYARTIFEDSTGNIWVGWCGKTLNGKTNGEVIIYDYNGNPLKTVIRGDAVYSIFEDNSHNIWIGTRDSGLIILEPDGQGDYRQHSYSANGAPDGLSHNAVFDITQDADGRIWIATLGGGVNEVDSGYDVTDLKFSVPGGYPVASHSRARSLLVNGKHIFAGTDTGLLHADLSYASDRMKFTPVKYDGQAPAEEIIHLIQEAGDTILISSFGKGIYRYICTDGTTEPIAADDIAARQPVFSALPYGKDRLWVTSRNAIMLYDLAGNEPQFITPVDRQFTLLETKPMCDTKCQCWFATTDGLVRVHIPGTHADYGVHKVIFTHLTQFCNDSTFTRPLTHADSIIILEPGIRDISLSVSSLPFGSPDAVRYFWRIVDRDSVWTATDGKHSLTLTGLKPGNVNLEVRSTDIYGRDLDNIGHVEIYVTPHWYETQVVRAAVWIIGTIVVVFLLLFIMRYRRLRSLYDSVVNSQAVARVSAAITEIKDIDDLTDADREFLDNINARIEKSLGDSDFSIDTLVESIGMSRSAFYRKLKSVVGQTPTEYLNKYRLSRAATMLHDNSDKSIASIAYECGFSSPQYFNNLFRRRYQMTPNEWRKKGC